MEATKPRNIRIATLRSIWNEENACQAVGAWLRLPTSRAERFHLVAGQTHELALGARKAFHNIVNHEQQKRWLGLPLIGVGIAKQVEPLVDSRILAAAVVTSLTMDVALRSLFQSLKTRVQPEECTRIDAFSYPRLEQLKRYNDLIRPTQDRVSLDSSFQ